jgi:hypothetical protein
MKIKVAAATNGKRMAVVLTLEARNPGLRDRHAQASGDPMKDRQSVVKSSER